MSFAGCIPRFIKAHAGWILTALGSAGLAGTVILTAKEAPEVKERTEFAAMDKRMEWYKDCLRDYYDDPKAEPTYDPDETELIIDSERYGHWPELTFWEKVKIAAPVYLPAILMGAGTLGCFWGAQIFNMKKQAMLVSALGALTMQFDQYREAIKAEYGEEADRKAFEVSQMEVKRLQEELKKLKEECGSQLYEFASLPGVVIEAMPAQFINALMHYNRNMILRGWGDLQELYKFTGVPESCYDVNEAKTYGWQLDENEVTWGSAYVDFFFQKVKNRSGREVNVVYSYIPPYEVNVDYGFEGDSTGREYEKYNPNMAAEFAKSIGENEIVQVDKDWNCYVPSVF